MGSGMVVGGGTLYTGTFSIRLVDCPGLSILNCLDKHTETGCLAVLAFLQQPVHETNASQSSNLRAGRTNDQTASLCHRSSCIVTGMTQGFVCHSRLQLQLQLGSCVLLLVSLNR